MSRPTPQAPSIPLGALPGASPSVAALAAQNTELETAIRVARRMLASYGTVDSDSVHAYTVAHGGLTEALRLLLRALNAEPVSAMADNPRCPAAHPEDPTPCVGPVVVTILDRHNSGADGCEHHGARLLASLDGGRPVALPHAHTDTASRVFKAVAGIRPFPWVERGERR